MHNYSSTPSSPKKQHAFSMPLHHLRSVICVQIIVHPLIFRWFFHSPFFIFRLLFNIMKWHYTWCKRMNSNKIQRSDNKKELEYTKKQHCSNDHFVSLVFFPSLLLSAVLFVVCACRNEHIAAKCIFGCVTTQLIVFQTELQRSKMKPEREKKRVQQ